MEDLGDASLALCTSVPGGWGGGGPTLRELLPPHLQWDSVARIHFSLTRAQTQGATQGPSLPSVRGLQPRVPYDTLLFFSTFALQPQKAPSAQTPGAAPLRAAMKHVLIENTSCDPRVGVAILAPMEVHRT